MASAPESPGAADRIAATVRAALEDIVRDAVNAIWDRVPAYHTNPDPQLRQDVRAHVRSVFRIFLAALDGARPAQRRDFSFTREQATLCVPTSHPRSSAPA